MRLWVKILAGIAAGVAACLIAWRCGLLRPRPEERRTLMENEEVWDVISDEHGIPQRIVIHRKVVGG
ncbi:MAG: hypothetical protein JRD89_07125 [Deltaproteobacteria bacterium]|nr:hypothetical protein [Deltaproteobacteria bacterium]